MRETRWIAGPLVLLGLVFLTGCIVSETRHTLYLEPDGSVDWVVRQTDVRATGDASEKRDVEERRYLEKARRGEHGPAVGMREIGASSVRTKVLRDERPFSIETTARFSAVDRMFEDFLRTLDVEVDASFERIRGGRRLTVVLSGIDVGEPVEPETDPAEDEDDAELDLLDGDLRLVLTRGAFVEVRGFVTTDHDDTVVLSWEGLEDQVDADGTLTLFLEWTVR